MEKLIHQAAHELLVSYSQVGGLNHGEGTNLPSKPAIGSICEDLLQVLFPGFHDEGPVVGHELQELTRARVASLAERLDEEICKSLRTLDSDCPRDRAREILENFFPALPGLRELLQTDIEAAYEGDPAARNFEEIILSYPSIEAVSIQRLAHLLHRQNVPLLPRIMTEWAHSRTGIDIHPGATIGTHFFIDHGTGVVIGETCRIGNRVKLYHGVTLGARSFQKDDEGKIVKGGKRHPDVEDGVTIYPNSTILGGNTVIGEGSTIGANVFLMQSVPPRSLVTIREHQLEIIAKR
jgi:serine O-acetyltransferase